MSFLKWFLIIIGSLTVLSLAVIAGGAYWLWRSAEEIKLTEADLQVGGSYDGPERAAVQKACSSKFDETMCTCIVERAGTEMSHVDRLMLIPALEGSFITIMATSAALARANGAPEEKIREAMLEARVRLPRLMKACGESATDGN